MPAACRPCSGACRAERPRSASGVKLGCTHKSPSRVRFRANRTSSRHGPRTESDPNPGTGRIEIPQYSGLRPHRGVLSLGRKPRRGRRRPFDDSERSEPFVDITVLFSRSGTNSHLQDVLRNKRFSRASGTTGHARLRHDAALACLVMSGSCRWTGREPRPIAPDLATVRFSA